MSIYLEQKKNYSRSLGLVPVCSTLHFADIVSDRFSYCTMTHSMYVYNWNRRENNRRGRVGKSVRRDLPCRIVVNCTRQSLNSTNFYPYDIGTYDVSSRIVMVDIKCQYIYTESPDEKCLPGLL